MNLPAQSVTEYIQLLKSRKLRYYNENFIESPIVSIISAFYNDFEYFEETYKSIIHQSFQNFEWLIVDSGSEDYKSLSLLQSIPQRSEKIKVFHQNTNMGVSTARNVAIDHAKGKYLFFMDSDDILDPTYIEKCVLFLELNPEFSFVNSYAVGFQNEEYWWNQGFNDPRRFINENLVTAMLLYRATDFKKIGGYDEKLRFYEDWERWLRALSKGQQAWTIPEYLHCYRRTNNGLLSRSRRNVQEEKRITKLIIDRYRQYWNQVPENFTIKPLRFNTEVLGNKLSIENFIQEDNNDRRILCLFPHLEIGGSDKFNIDLLTLLKERGFDITIATTLPSKNLWYSNFYKITPDIFNLYNLGDKGHWLKLVSYFIKSRCIDVCLISNSYYSYYLLPFLRAEFPHVAFVDYTHADDPSWRGGGYPRVSCQMRQFLDLQVVSSQYLANYYKQLSSEEESKLRVCPTNVDTNYWQHSSRSRLEVRKYLQIPSHSVVLFYPARLSGQKRPLFFVEIIKTLQKQFNNVVVIAVKLGELLEPMEEIIDRYNLNHCFRLIEPANSEEMQGYYNASDILLLPSKYEGIALAIYEGMAMGLPIVASDVGGNGELLTPDTGFLIPLGEGNDEEINQYVSVLSQLVVDESLRSKMGYSARQRVVKHFSLAQMADRMEEIFKEARALSKSQSQFCNNSTNLALAKELLVWFNEYSEVDDSWNYICSDREYYLERIKAMESSKFWKLRKLWFKVKRWVGLTDEEP